MNPETETQTIYFTARSGKVVSHDTDEDRKVAQAYVNRNNAAAARRGDDTKPYRVLSYTVAAR